MVFDHVVEYKHIYYPAGTDVPIENEGVSKADAPISNEAVSEKKSYTKEELNEMSIKEIKKVASENGITLKKVSPKSAVIAEFLDAIK